MVPENRKWWKHKAEESAIRGARYPLCMDNTTSLEGSGAPEKVQTAERWRIAGARLRELAPAVSEQIFAMLLSSIPDGDEAETDPAMQQSYFLT